MILFLVKMLFSLKFLLSYFILLNKNLGSSSYIYERFILISSSKLNEYGDIRNIDVENLKLLKKDLDHLQERLVKRLETFHRLGEISQEEKEDIEVLLKFLKHEWTNDFWISCFETLQKEEKDYREVIFIKLILEEVEKRLTNLKDSLKEKKDYRYLCEFGILIIKYMKNLSFTIGEYKDFLENILNAFGKITDIFNFLSFYEIYREKSENIELNKRKNNWIIQNQQHLKEGSV